MSTLGERLNELGLQWVFFCRFFDETCVFLCLFGIDAKSLRIAHAQTPMARQINTTIVSGIRKDIHHGGARSQR